MLEIDNNRDYPEEEMKPAGQQTPLADAMEVFLGLSNPVEGNVSMRARELDELTRQRFAGFFMARLVEAEEAYTQRKGFEKLPASFAFRMDDGMTEVYIVGSEDEEEGYLKQKRTVVLGPLAAGVWEQKITIERSMSEITARDGERGVNSFSYVSSTEYRITSDGERVPLKDSAYTVRRIDASLDMVDAVFAVTRQTLPPEPDEGLPAQPDIPPPVGLIPTPHGEAAAQWLATVANLFPPDVDKKTRKVLLRSDPSEKPLSKDTIHGFSSHFIARVDAVIQEAPKKYFSHEGAVYYTDGLVIFQIERDDEMGIDAEGNMVQMSGCEREISLTPILAEESVAEALNRIRSEQEDYPWKIVILIENGVDMQHTISYFDVDEEFCLGKARGREKKYERLPLLNTPRAVKLTENVIQQLERIVGIAS